ncbi:50S ribosomal protein L7 [Oscillospiraceae bacterium PP1C4]
MNDKLFSAISLCRKAGKLKMGSDVVKEEVLDGSAALVLLTNDLVERSERQTRFVCENNRTKVRSLPYSMEQLWPITGKKYGILAVCDSGFAKMIEGLLPPET